MCVCVCVHAYTPLPSNQNFDKQISSQWRGGGVSRVGQWVRMAMEYKQCLYLLPDIRLLDVWLCLSLCTRQIVRPSP